MNFVDIDSDDDDDIFFLANAGENAGYYLFYYENTGSPDSAKYEFVTDEYSPYNYNYGNYSNSYPPMTTFADIDGDNDYDLFIAYGSVLRLYENTGDSLTPNFDFSNWNAVLNVTTDYCNYPAFVDIDFDGDLDIFLKHFLQIQFYRNTGNRYNYNYVLENDDLIPGFNPAGNVILFDTNNDNDYDLFVAGEIKDIGGGTTDFSRIWLFENIGTESTPEFKFKTSFYDSIYDISQIYFADINADGDYDLFTGNMDWQKSIRFCRNIGTPDSASFFLEDSAIVTIERYEDVWPSPLLFDMDNDEDLDLVVSMRETVWAGDHPVHFFENIGDKYTPAWSDEDTSYIMPYGVYDYWDYDKDNDYDLICSPNYTTGGQALIFENTGTPDSSYFTYKMPIDSIYLDPMIYGYGTISLVDIDSDGDKDVFIGEDAGGVHFFRNDGLVGINKQNPYLPFNFILYQNYPNPFNQNTVIKYNLNKTEEVHIAVFDILGRKVKTLVDDPQSIGIHQVQWDGTNNRGELLSSGIYFYWIKLKNSNMNVTQQKKMLFLK